MMEYSIPNLTHSIGYGVMSISIWSELLVGLFVPLFLQEKPFLITNLKPVWKSMLIMSQLIFGIRFLQNIMNMLFDMSNLFNKFGFSIYLGLSILCRCNRWSYVTWGQYMEPHVYLKRVVSNRIVKRSFIAKLNIRKDWMPSIWIPRVVHFDDTDYHHFDYLYLSIILGVESSRSGQLGVHH